MNVLAPYTIDKNETFHHDSLLYLMFDYIFMAIILSILNFIIILIYSTHKQHLFLLLFYLLYRQRFILK